MHPAPTHFAYGARIARQFGLKRAFTFWLAARREPEAMHAWRAFLQAQVTADARDGLMLRVLRPYMRQHFTPEQRRALLRDHYHCMATHFPTDPRLVAEPGLVVATLHGKGEAPCTLHLGGNTSKEGEMSFTFCDGAGNMLAKLAATIGADESGAPVLWIGGLQGAKPPLGRDEIVKATRELYGLRPKAAVMLVAQAVARMLGLTALRAPGNEGHISQRGFRRLRSKRKIYADYGQFWEEIGGTALAAEEYRIPVEPQVRDISEVKPHKRSEWKKRQALSEQLTSETLATLQALRLPAATE